LEEQVFNPKILPIERLPWHALQCNQKCLPSRGRFCYSPHRLTGAWISTLNLVMAGYACLIPPDAQPSVEPSRKGRGHDDADYGTSFGEERNSNAAKVSFCRRLVATPDPGCCLEFDISIGSRSRHLASVLCGVNVQPLLSIASGGTTSPQGTTSYRSRPAVSCCGLLGLFHIPRSRQSSLRTTVAHVIGSDFPLSHGSDCCQGVEKTFPKKLCGRCLVPVRFSWAKKTQRG